jgi:S-adenosylmethionine synthetase
MSFNDILVSTKDKKLTISAKGGITELKDKYKLDVSFHVNKMHARKGIVPHVINQFPVKKFMMKQVDNLGDIYYTGDFSILWKKEKFSGVLTTAVGKLNFNLTLDENTKYLINPSGSFILGGSWGDSGTTGRKIVVDTYGGYAPIGGGCFSSKDPTKVDRSAAYYARYVCRNLVANGLAKKCQIELSYAIGKAEPVSVYVQSFGTSEYSDDELLAIVMKNFNFSVANIISELDLRRPIYAATVNYGHFGKPDMPWEQFKKINL